MARLFPAMDFLYLHDSSVDLYLKSLRDAIKTIPHEVLQANISCKPVIMDYSDSRDGEDCGIVLGHGFHKSDFYYGHPEYPSEGLVFCLNPPYADEVENVRIYHTEHGERAIPIRSSFMIGKNRFILTCTEFNLDEVVCGNLSTGDLYKKPEPCKPVPTNDIPF